MEQTVAASSPAEVEDVFQGQNVSMADYDHYRKTGELPEQFKPAETEEPQETDSPEETAVVPEDEESETVPDSEPEEEVQEQPQKGSAAEKRIKQLLARVKELERTAKPDVKTEPSPAQPQYTRPKPTADDKKQDGSPKYATYEDFVEDLADWKSEQRIAQHKREQAEQEALNALKVKLDDARSRYEDADDVIFPAAQTIKEAQIPMAVKQVFADSDVFPDLCYVVGSDPEELKKFVSLAQTNPRAALAKVFEYERGIREELAKPESGKAPEPKKTSAPKPPSPVGGGSSKAFDVSDESLSPEEWMRKRNADLKKRGKA